MNMDEVLNLWKRIITISSQIVSDRNLIEDEDVSPDTKIRLLERVFANTGAILDLRTDLDTLYKIPRDQLQFLKPYITKHNIALITRAAEYLQQLEKMWKGEQT